MLKGYLAEVGLDDLWDILDHGQESRNDPQKPSPDQQPCPTPRVTPAIIMTNIPPADGGKEYDGDSGGDEKVAKEDF